MESGDASTRARAAAYLSLFEQLPGATFPALARRLGDADPRVRDATLTTIVQLGKRRASEHHTLDTLLTARLALPLDSVHRATLARAVGALGAGSRTAPTALLRALDDSAALVRCAATTALAQRAVPAVAIRNRLMHAVRHDASDCVRAESLGLLVSSVDPPPSDGDSLQGILISVAHSALADRSPIVRQEAAFASAALANGSQRLVDALLAATTDSASEVRAAVAHALGELDVGENSRRARDTALRRVSRDASAVVRAVASRALAQAAKRSGRDVQ
jgi:HEAT repeat protein